MFPRRMILFLMLIAICVALVYPQTGSRSAPGRFKAGWRSVTVTRANATTFTARLYYPALTQGQNAAYDGSGAPYPAVTFGHGFFQAVATYQSTLEHLATRGYFVIATDSEGGLLPNHQNFANDIRQSLTYLEQENASQASVLFNQVLVTRFGASGHSMGGGASILAASQDSRIKALANLAAADTNPSAIAAMPAVTAPASLISGSADTIVPVASNGQLMYNAGTTPKILPVIQGAWHCGFQDASGFGCDSGTIPRADQLSETRRLLTAFFDLYLRSDETAWKEVWGAEPDGPLVQAQRNPGFELTTATQTVTAPVGSDTTFSVTVINRRSVPSSFTVFVDQRRWIVDVQPRQTAVLNQNESQTVTFKVRRLWKNPAMLNSLLISARSDADQLTRAFAVINLQ